MVALMNMRWGLPSEDNAQPQPFAYDVIFSSHFIEKTRDKELFDLKKDRIEVFEANNEYITTLNADFANSTHSSQLISSGA